VEDTIDGSAQVRQAMARLERAVTSAQVAKVVVESGLSAANATSGALVLVTDDQSELRPIHAVGRAADPAGVVVERRLPVSATFPLMDVARSRQELWLAHPKALTDRYPEAVSLEDAGSWAVLPLLIDGPILGAVGWSFRGHWFTSDQRACLRSLARAAEVALYRAGLFDAERRARAEADFARFDVLRRDTLMAEVSAIVDATRDSDKATASLAGVARLTLPLLGEWCGIDVLDDKGRLHQVAAAHVDPAAEQLLREANGHGTAGGRKLPRALSEGKPVNIPVLVDSAARRSGLSVRHVRALYQVGLRRALVVPLRIHGQTLGTLCVAARDVAGVYSAADLALASRIARRCAASLEYNRLHDSAERANQGREDIVAATSHELRIPLSHIKGFVSTLRTTDTVWDRDTRDDFLAEIELETDRLARLVETLLDRSRIDSGGLDPLARTVTSPAALVESGVDRVGTSLGDHQLELQLPDDLPPVLVEASQVERVIANLLDNAAKYSPPFEPIGITGRLTGDYVTLRIEDRGPGIPPEHLDRVFEPFFREPPQGYPVKPGTGLGLAICRSIIRSQNGRIWAEQRQGGGAALVFTLPVVASSGRT
jgi:signal transduction histidine kinase